MSAKYECDINHIALKFGARRSDVSGGESIPADDGDYPAGGADRHPEQQRVQVLS